MKRERESKNLTRSALARRIGQQHARIAKLEKGGSDLRLSSILQLTEALEITPGQLLDDMAEELRTIRREMEQILSSSTEESLRTMVEDQVCSSRPLQ